MEFLAAISDPEHPERESLLAWAGGSYDPDAFDPSTVVFDALKRWKGAFESQRR